MRVLRLATTLWLALPHGSHLPDEVWHRRHRGILVLLWLQAVGAVGFSVSTGHGLGHSLLEGGLIGSGALAATLPLRPRWLRASAAAFGLIASAAILVHLSGGYIEAHFYFFVMVGLLALYQEWAPFLLAITFVLLHHGVVGVVNPAVVYNHPAAIAHPWRWAAIHAGFIAAMSAVSLLTWRVNETTHAAAGLATARLVDALKTRQARLKALLEVGQDLSRLQPVEPLLSRIAAACGRLFDAKSVSFRLVDGDDLALCGSWGATDEDLRPPVKIGDGLTGTVAATGEPLLVQDPANDPRFLPAYREAYQRLGVRAFLGVPVKTADRVVGVLNIRSGQATGFSAADIDMAKAFAAQAAVALENSRLFQETQRTIHELSQTRDQLVQAQKMEAVGQLAGGVAHDFNNLLTVIRGRSHLFLGRAPADDPGRHDVELIDQTAERAAALTRQLLAFSRKQVLQPKALDLNALVGSVAPMLTRLIGEDIELVIVPGRDIGQVMADPGQLEQVIMNLVVNARDAMPDGGMVQIDAEARDLDTAARHAQGQVPPGRYVLLRVHDSGRGMDSVTLGRIFEPFFTTKEPGKGTGLGLSTVHGIVHQSGGAIGVDSAEGRGTTFSIYLPRVDQPVEATPAQPAQALARGTETILLVEDDHEVRRLTAEVLTACGYTVLDSNDPLKALVIGERHRAEIRLLITDMGLPAMRGPELAAEILRLQPATRVLYMSGYLGKGVASADPIDPPGPLLQKPFAPAGLARIVRQVLDSELAAR